MKKAELKVKLLTHTPNPDLVVATAAKLCYSPVGVDEIQEKLTPEQIDKFVNMLASIGHESPLEHVSFTFALEGLTRTTSHQIVRHRIASFSQQSQRYVNMNERFRYVVPPIVKVMGEQFEEEWDKDMEVYHNTYVKWQNKIQSFVEETNYPTYGMSSEKVANENARDALPGCSETKMIFTMNGRSLLNFLKHRECNRAQQPIVMIAKSMREQLIEVAPALFKLSGAACRNGKCPEGKMTCGVPYTK